MNTQPTDPRALKAAENLASEAFFSEDAIPLVARIIQSHFAESVNGKLLEALENLVEGFTPEADFEFHDPKCPALFGTWKDCNCPSLKDWREAREAIALAQSQPPSMADELAEALREYANRCPNCGGSGSYGRLDRNEHVEQIQCEWCDAALTAIARYSAQKGQS